MTIIDAARDYVQYKYYRLIKMHDLVPSSANSMF